MEDKKMPKEIDQKPDKTMDFELLEKIVNDLAEEMEKPDIREAFEDTLPIDRPDNIIEK